MDIKRLHEIIEMLVCYTKKEIDESSIECVDTDEMGKVADIIKDLAEAQYYRTLVEAMEDAEYGKDYDWHGMKDGGKENVVHSHDAREGRSGHSRKSYMETREMHKGDSVEEKQKKLKELENYLMDLTGDIMDMIADALPEERAMLKTKIQTLATKI